MICDKMQCECIPATEADRADDQPTMRDLYVVAAVSFLLGCLITWLNMMAVSA